MGGDGGEPSFGRWSRGRDQAAGGAAEVDIIESVVCVTEKVLRFGGPHVTVSIVPAGDGARSRVVVRQEPQGSLRAARVDVVDGSTGEASFRPHTGLAQRRNCRAHPSWVFALKPPGQGRVDKRTGEHLVAG